MNDLRSGWLDAPRRLVPASPILAADALREIACQALAMTTADTMAVRVHHIANGVTRVMNNRVRINEGGVWFELNLHTQFGQRVSMDLTIDQYDSTSLRQAVAYLERIAREQPGDSLNTTVPISPRQYPPNTVWSDTTMAAYREARHDAISALVQPLIDAQLTAGVFVGVLAKSAAYADKQGIVAAGQETDAEMAVTGWTGDRTGMGWAGQAARDWARFDPHAIADTAVQLTHKAGNPAPTEPGRRTVILAPAALAAIVRTMDTTFSARYTLAGGTALSDRIAHRPKVGEQVLDPRITLTTDPNDPEGGFIPFNWFGYPRTAMTWIAQGVLKALAYDAGFAAEQGVTPASDVPDSLRMSGGPTTLDEMIGNCQEGIYVNRIANVKRLSPLTGTITGVTTGGCFLIKNGKLTTAIKNLRFVESPWHFLNRVEAIGPTARAPFGYAPWAGKWPIAPIIVPPVMVRDFNFTALAEAV